MRRTTKVLYNIKVSHEGRSFEQDMDFLSPGATAVYKCYLFLRDKYKGYEIKIIKITTTQTTEEIPENKLEALAKEEPESS